VWVPWDAARLRPPRCGRNAETVNSDGGAVAGRGADAYAERMNRWKAASFLFAYVVPGLMPFAAWLGATTARIDAAAWFPLVFLFVLLPIADYAIGVERSNPTPEQASRLEHALWFRALTWLCLPIQIALLAWSARHFVQAPFELAGRIGWVLSQGVVSGVLAINVAHELIHKASRAEQWLGGLLLASVGYHGFKVEHLRGHHVHVSTPEDASSARRGQSLWHFLPRALARNTHNAWRLEAERLRRRGAGALHWRNELLWWSAAWLAFCAAATAIAGAAGLAFFLLQGLFAALSLEIINYVEHYGLERRRLTDGRYERPTRLHSWNSAYRLSNALLFQLQRHSDHHETPRRRYAALLHHDDAPQLPGGYAAMFVLAMFPPLWFRVIDPRVDEALRGAGASGA
jgi:alkane 1-monooxygenase